MYNINSSVITIITSIIIINRHKSFRLYDITVFDKVCIYDGVVDGDKFLILDTVIDV